MKCVYLPPLFSNIKRIQLEETMEIDNQTCYNIDNNIYKNLSNNGNPIIKNKYVALGLNYNIYKRKWKHIDLYLDVEFYSSNLDVFLSYNSAPVNDWVIFDAFTGDEAIDSKLFYWYYDYGNIVGSKIKFDKDIEIKYDFAMTERNIEYRDNITLNSYGRQDYLVKYQCFGMLIEDYINLCKEYGENFIRTFIKNDNIFAIDYEKIDKEVDNLIK